MRAKRRFPHRIPSISIALLASVVLSYSSPSHAEIDAKTLAEKSAWADKLSVMSGFAEETEFSEKAKRFIELAKLIQTQQKLIEESNTKIDSQSKRVQAAQDKGGPKSSASKDPDADLALMKSKQAYQIKDLAILENRFRQMDKELSQYELTSFKDAQERTRASLALTDFRSTCKSTNRPTKKFGSGLLHFFSSIWGTLTGSKPRPLPKPAHKKDRDPSLFIFGVESDMTDLVKDLIVQGADVNETRPSDGKSALEIAMEPAKPDQSTLMGDILMAAGANLSVSRKALAVQLNRAIQKSDPEAVGKVLEKCPKDYVLAQHLTKALSTHIDAQQSWNLALSTRQDYNTKLSRLINANKIVDLLAKQTPKEDLLKIRIGDDLSPLMVSVKVGAATASQILDKVGTEGLRHVTSTGRSAIGEAARAGDLILVQMFIKAGGSVRLPPGDYETPLMGALLSGHRSTISVVLNETEREKHQINRVHKFPVEFPQFPDGLTAWDIAVNTPALAEQPGLLEALKKAGAVGVSQIKSEK